MQIYHQLFGIQFTREFNKLPIASTMSFNSLRIMDGTTIKLPSTLQHAYPSTVGAGVKYQLEFDYITGKLLYMELQAGKDSDSPSGMKRIELIQKNDLILQDLGYFKIDLFRNIEKKEAFYVSRARTDTMFYIDSPNPRYDKNGEIIKKYAHIRLFIEKEAQAMKRGEMKEFPNVYVGKHDRMPVRLLIYRRTIDEQKKQEFRIKRRRQTKPGEIKKKSKDLADISFYITNLPLNIPGSEVANLYRYRWQIELLFKSWKSDMKVAHYREMKLERWRCHLYAELILLMISLLITYQLRIYFWTEKHFILSEQITMREVSKIIWEIWQARAGPSRQKIVGRLVEILARIGQKNTKAPGPLGWIE
jgi:hypothetical protein